MEFYEERGQLCLSLIHIFRNYKCFLKAGCQVEPEMYEDKLVLFFFGKGTGYITEDVYKRQAVYIVRILQLVDQGGSNMIGQIEDRKSVV